MTVAGFDRITIDVKQMNGQRCVRKLDDRAVDAMANLPAVGKACSSGSSLSPAAIAWLP